MPQKSCLVGLSRVDSSWPRYCQCVYSGQCFTQVSWFEGNIPCHRACQETCLPFLNQGVNSGSKVPSQINTLQDIAWCFEKGNITKCAYLCGPCSVGLSLRCTACSLLWMSACTPRTHLCVLQLLYHPLQHTLQSLLGHTQKQQCYCKPCITLTIYM